MRSDCAAIVALDMLFGGIVLATLGTAPAVAELCTNTGFGPIINFPVGHGPFAVTVGDFNGDGKLDLAAANATSDDVTVLLGDGSGGIGETSGSSNGGGGLTFTICAAGCQGNGR